MKVSECNSLLIETMAYKMKIRKLTEFVFQNCILYYIYNQPRKRFLLFKERKTIIKEEYAIRLL